MRSEVIMSYNAEFNNVMYVDDNNFKRMNHTFLLAWVECCFRYVKGSGLSFCKGYLHRSNFTRPTFVGQQAIQFRNPWPWEIGV